MIEIDPNAPPVVMSTGTAPPVAPQPARHGARLDQVLADAAALAGHFQGADIRVEVTSSSVRACIVHATASGPSRVTIAEGRRFVEVYRARESTKATTRVTVEGAIASALRSLAAKSRAEADDRVTAARKALREAVEAASAAAERETRLNNVVLEDLAAVGETGELSLKQPEVSP